MLSIYEDKSLNNTLIALFLKLHSNRLRSRSQPVIWAIGLYGAFLFIQLAPLFFWNLGNKALYNHFRRKIALSALGFSSGWPSLNTSRVQVERISFIPKPVHLSLFSLPLHSSLFELCFETCFHKILYLFRHPLNADLSFCNFSILCFSFKLGQSGASLRRWGKIEEAS